MNRWFCILCKDKLLDWKTKRFIKTNYRLTSKDRHKYCRICTDCYKSVHNLIQKDTFLF